MGYDPANDPNAKLVGRKLPGVRLGEGIPALDQLKDQVKKVGGLDITHVKFHAPCLLPVTKEGSFEAWGVMCLGCSIENNSPLLRCIRYSPSELFHAWPGHALMIEIPLPSADEDNTEAQATE